MENEPNQLKKIERDENGLVKGLNYTFDENGRVLWRKLIKNEYLVPNKDKTKETDISKLEDKDILLLLAGFKELADIRGFNSIDIDVINPSPDFCAARCIISWIPSYESEGRTVTFVSTADSTLNNTSPIGGKYFLTTTAENRSFVRCVRNFLRIPILGKDEISFGGNTSEAKVIDNSKQIKLLKDLMDKKKIGWKHIVDRMKKDDAEKLAELTKTGQETEFTPKWNDKYTGIEHLPNDVLFDFLSRIKRIELPT